MNTWEHLFIDGEFMPRDRLLAGLTLEQVTARPPGLSHSIYEELWHTARWQTIVVRCDGPAREAWVDGGQQFPGEPPDDERAWIDLVAEFLDGSRQGTELARVPERLTREAYPGETLAEALASLAVHNAYHLGKIVALRQAIGAWPPPE